MLVFLSLLEWKPLVKMKMMGDLSWGIKVWDTLFYLLGESNAGASCTRKFIIKKKKLSFHLSRCVSGILEVCGYCRGGF